MLCEASEILHYPANTGYKVLASLVLFCLFSAFSGLVEYHWPCNQMKLLQSAMSEYCQVFYEQLECN